MSKPEYQDIINEYKEQVRILKQEVAELQDAGKSKDSANKRTLQKLEHVTTDLEEANKKIKELENSHDKETKIFGINLLPGYFQDTKSEICISIFTMFVYSGDLFASTCLSFRI